MSKYSTAQEYRIKKWFEDHPDIELLEYYGSRTKNAGDFLIKIGTHRVRVDHKSTTKESFIVLEKEWLVKLSGLALRRIEKEGHTMPVISFALKDGRGGVWCFSPSKPGRRLIIKKEILTKHKSIRMYGETIRSNNLIRIIFDGYTTYVWSFRDFVKGVLSG